MALRSAPSETTRITRSMWAASESTGRFFVSQKKELFSLTHTPKSVPSTVKCSSDNNRALNRTGIFGERIS